MRAATIAEYQRALAMFEFSLVGDSGIYAASAGGGSLWLVGAGDNYSELQILEAEMLEAIEGLA